MKQRRSLTHVGGEVERWGDRNAAAALAEALDVAPAPEPQRKDDKNDAAPDDPDRAHVHGFHAYPARMHPATAARLVRAVSRDAGQVVLDPFCGSGTVLVEAMIAGRRAVGIDLNPLAVRLATLKTTPFDATRLEALVTAAHGVAAFADDRRTRRAGATRRYPPDDVAAFDPHVLLELDSIQAAIQAAKADPLIHEALALVLSAILVKVSRHASDTSGNPAPRRLAAGYPARLFVRKTGELARRLSELAALLPPGTLPARVSVDDATRMRAVGASTVDAVVTSPPYVATYDYVAHHALRMRWLGIDARPFGKGEIGSRRRYATLESGQAREEWKRELLSFLRPMARACRKDARLALVLADSAVGDEAVRADELLGDVAAAAGLDLVARASQRRPHFHGPTAPAFDRVPRAEHAFALVKR